ncbi:MAG: acyl-CoA synthetase, partial [Pseudonocardia sp.]|nr:acyl-CoA synthetase [Pseudonocardia sp.]
MQDPMLHQASSYDELWSQVDFATMDIPEEFNLGVACADRHDPGTRALTVVARDRSSRDYTFGELTGASNRLANALAAVGIGRGDVVGVVNPASFETGTCFMGLFRMGAIALPLSSLFGPDALRFRLRNAEAKAVITSAVNAPRVREALTGVEVPILVIGGPADAEDSYERALAAASPDFTPVRTRAEDPAFLIYTSGTTGDPKGALH